MNNYASLIPPEEVIESVRQKAGHEINDILSKESELGILALLGAVEILVGSKIHKGLSTSSAERMVFAFAWLAREVGTGGFYQFFINSAGDFWPDVLRGLEAIGDSSGAETFRKALAIFPASRPPENRDSRLRQLNALEDTDGERVAHVFTEMTNRYLANPFPNWESLFDYVKRHRTEFDLREA
jgi:hypothetical protein